MALAVVAVVGLAAGIRLRGLADIDLFCDEALTSEIASSLWNHGELSAVRFSRFLPDRAFRGATFSYFPPLYYVVAAPFTPLRERLGPNLVPRLPSLLAGLLLIALFVPAARTIFADARVGLAAAALTATNGFHIGMSRMVLPYALLPPLLLVALVALLRALRADRARDWIAAATALTASVLVNQVAVLFWALVAPAALVSRHQRAVLRRLVLCFAVPAVVFLIWAMVLPRAVASAFLQTTAGYSFTGQLAKIVSPYAQMLSPWPMLVVFAGGVIAIAARRRDLAAALLLIWVLLPGTMLLTRSMWILDYHLYFVYPPVILIAAYGSLAAVDALLIRPALRRYRAVAGAAAIALFGGSEWCFAPPDLPRAAYEFGSPQILSAAAAHIRAHDGGEAVIAPTGTAEAYYLERFVQTKNRGDAVADCLALVARAPAWVFMGDNYFHNGRLDACDDYVRAHGTLIMHSAPRAPLADAGNPLGYALYYLASPDRRP